MYYRAIYLLIIIFLNSTCYGRFHSRFHHISINENEISSRHLLSFNLINSIKSYQLVSTNIQLHKYFTIENKTHLYAVQSLDREYLCAEQFCSCLTQCSLQLKILSQPEHQIIFVNITINDLNDNLHYFRSNEIQIHIPENTNIQHRQCYRIPNVEDKDLLETNQFIYQLIGNGSEKFEIDQTIGNDLCLRIKNHPLDREERHQYDHLWIIVTDKQQQQAKMQINIQVLDVNDNSPKFLTNLTKVSVNETFTGELICVQAYDPDEGNNGRIIYSFDHFDDKLTQFLYLNNETGCLFILKSLLLTSIDLIPLLQLNNHLLLTIRAQDCGSRMSSTLPVYHPLEIIIDDINDHKPTIQVRQIISSIDIIKNNSQINIIENTIGILAMITVDDIDQGIYGQVQLNLIVQTSIKKHRQAFQLKSTSMKHYKIELVSPLDYELESTIILFLDAIDGGGTPPLSSDAKLTIKVNDINEYCPHLVNFSSEPYIFVSRQRFKKIPAEKFSYRLFAFDKDISDQSNITFNLLPSTYSSAFKLTTNGLLTIDDLPLKLPSIIELDYSLTDTFFPEPCIKQDKLIILIGDTSIDRDYLINEYEKQLETSQHQRLITQKLANNKRKRQETIILFLTFSLSTSVIFLGILCLLCLFCCRKQKRRNRQRSITTKSSSLINPSLLEDSKQQSPHSFITDCNGKSSLLPPLR
ncbi:unnamed protein product [Rotaria magnacalcarata]|uniref:Cadherin domain-containing protein n=2 Tax=Rotaria magnacalcarata TaxID=392030 RepID=A0A8S2KTL7_9BILA|nr:unnamed protein product [Rotaria magnacalcarata]